MKVLNKKMASLAVAAVMAAGGIGIAKIVSSNHVMASADTGIVSVAETGAIGIGETNKATVNVSEGNPATLTLKNVTAGQYYLMAKVANVSPDDWVDLSAQIGGNYAYLTYNAYAGAYIALVTVEADSEIVLSTFMGNYTVDVYLGGLFMGASTDNSIYGLKIANGMSRTVELENVKAGNYYINVQLDYGYNLDAGAKLYTQLDNGAKVELEYKSTMYGYTAQINIAGATTLTISTDNGEVLVVNVSLYPEVTVNTQLPMTEAASFAQYEAKSFYYTADKTGYFTISAKSTPANAEFSYTLKTNPNDLVSTYIPDSDFPMYFVEGENYYFDITYTGIPYEDGMSYEDIPTTATATFSFEEWNASAIVLNKVEYMPVTMNTDTKTVSAKVVGDVGTTYNIGLSNVPFEVHNIYIHYAGEVIAVDGTTDFSGQITIKAGYDTIYFTTDFEAEFVAGVALYYVPAVYDDVIELNKATSITLRAHETLMYYVFDIPAGAYEVTLTDNDGNVIVADAYDNTLIAKGANKGFFTVETYGDPTGTAYLYFTNDGDSAITFYVTVTKGASIVLGEETEITLSASESKTYYITGLTAGRYYVTLITDDGEVEVEVKWGETIVIEAGDEKGSFLISIDEWLTTTVALTFTNDGEDAATFSVRVVAE